MSPTFRSRTRTVRPVQQVGVALVRAQGLDEQPPPVCQDRRELPRALGLDLGRADRVPPAGPSPGGRPRSPLVLSAGRVHRTSPGPQRPPSPRRRGRGSVPSARRCPASSRNRRLRRVAATTTATAARQATWTRPVMTRPAVPRPPGTAAAGRAATGARPTRRRARRQQEARRDQPDHVSRMTVPGGRQEVLRRGGDRRAFHRRSAGWAGPGTGGWAERPGLSALQRPWSALTARAASSAHEAPRRTPAMASDSQCAPR